MDDVQIDWNSATVRDGRLTVELVGEAGAAFQESFARTLSLLAGGDWGEVRIKKHRLRVDEVAEGAEERLHHHLESLVAQANAEQQRLAEAPAEGSAVDAAMTARFRALA